MARMTAKRLPQRATPHVEHLDRTGSPLIWWAAGPDDAPPIRLDLSPFADGDASRELPAYPHLAAAFAPALRDLTVRKSRNTIEQYLINLRTFWRFLGILRDRDADIDDDIAAISPSLGHLYKLHLLNDLRRGPAKARLALALINTLLHATRQRLELVPHRLAWPNVQMPRRAMHRDVQPERLKVLYNAAKAVVRRFTAATAEGAALLSRGSDPRPYSGNRHVWAAPENIAWLTRHFLDRHLAEGGRESFTSMVDWRLYSSSIFPTSIPSPTPFDRASWFLPTAEDTAARLVLVLLHTGWNPETVCNLDISGDTWFQHRLELSAGETVALFATKNRTNREQVAFSLTRPEFHPYRVIKEQVTRSEPLRAALRRKLVALGTPASPTDMELAHKLRRMIASPWLFLSKKAQPGTGAVGVFLDSKNTFANCYKKLLADAGLDDESLTPSDLRDGFASFVYGNSAYNVLMVKRALGHGNLNATKHYLRQRMMLAQRFADFAAWSETLFDEIKRFRSVDPTILYIRARFGDVTKTQRQRLADHRLRTRMGMGCLDPENPPAAVAPAHERGMCTVQRCILCRHGVIFRDSFVPLARRLAEIQVIRGHTPVDRWDGSSFHAEWLAIEAAVKRVFIGRDAEFARFVEEHADQLRRGDAYLFDQIGDGASPMSADEAAP